MKFSYANALTLIKNNGRIYVAVIYENNRHEWLPVDKTEYIRQLEMITNAENVEYPCWLQVWDGDIYIHPKVKP